MSNQSKLDRLEVIAGYARYPVAVVSDREGKDFELISLDCNEGDTEVLANLVARGLHLIAAVGVLNGEFQIAMVNPLEETVAYDIGRAYAAYRRGLLATTQPQYDFLTREYRPS
jgi:hypothetical protein